METDKITQEGLAEATGVITFLSEEGDEVEIGSTIARIDDSAEKPAGDAAPAEEKEDAAAPESEEEPEPAVVAEVPKAKEEPSSTPVAEDAKPPDPVPAHSPAVRKILAETGIDPATLSGTGKDGRLTKADVLAASKEHDSASPLPKLQPQAKRQPAPVASADKKADGAEHPPTPCPYPSKRSPLASWRLSRTLLSFPPSTKLTYPQ